MRTAARVSDAIDNETDLQRALMDLRHDVASARTRDELTRLYRRAEAFITLTYTPAWQKKFAGDVEAMRRLAETEFTPTAHAINQRAAQLDTKADYDETWGGQQEVYGQVSNAADLRQIFAAIQRELPQATTRDDLTRLYRRAEYLVTLTYAPTWQQKFGDQLPGLRQVAERDFGTTAGAINERARTLGVAADYDATWGPGR